MTQPPPFREIDHTADAGLKIFGGDLSDLFIHAAQGLFSLICMDEFPWDRPERKHTSIKINLQANSLEDLLHDWLSELLYLHSTQKLIFTSFIINNISPSTIDAKLGGIHYENSDVQFLQEIKAVTYHQLNVIKVPEGYRAQVIFDI